jgi:hypothetical protein
VPPTHLITADRWPIAGNNPTQEDVYSPCHGGIMAAVGRPVSCLVTGTVTLYSCMGVVKKTREREAGCVGVCRCLDREEWNRVGTRNVRKISRWTHMCMDRDKSDRMACPTFPMVTWTRSAILTTSTGLPAFPLGRQTAHLVHSTVHKGMYLSSVPCACPGQQQCHCQQQCASRWFSQFGVDENLQVHGIRGL